MEITQMCAKRVSETCGLVSHTHAFVLIFCPTSYVGPRRSAHTGDAKASLKVLTSEKRRDADSQGADACARPFGPYLSAG